jgi:hypothetical protein
MYKNILIVFLQVSVLAPCLAGDLALSGMVFGKVVETKDKLIVEGATFVSNGNDLPVIYVGKNLKKEVIFSNVRIISNNQNIRDNTGTSGVFVVDNQDSKSKISLRNVHVFSRNANISSQNNANYVSAGVLNNNYGTLDSSTSVSVTTSGQTSIAAMQGTRPDFRKSVNR